MFNLASLFFAHAARNDKKGAGSQMQSTGAG